MRGSAFWRCFNEQGGAVLSLLRMVSCFVLLGLSGCSVFGGPLAPPMSAEELSVPAKPSDRTEVKEYLGALVVDSYKKCNRFVTQLVRYQAGVNTTGDVITTVLSGVATAVSPISVAHALSAASTIAGGTKTAVDADLWAKATGANFAQAINSTYYVKMPKYADGLPDLNPDKLVLTNEVGRLIAIHNQCAVASAETTIQTALAPPSTATQGASSQSTPGNETAPSLEAGRVRGLRPPGPIPPSPIPSRSRENLSIPGTAPWR